MLATVGDYPVNCSHDMNLKNEIHKIVECQHLESSEQRSVHNRMQPTATGLPVGLLTEMAFFF